MTGCTGSAWIVALPRTHVYAWTSERSWPTGGRDHARVAGTTVRTDGTRLSWLAQGSTVWIEAGPSASDTLPGRTALFWLVLATQRVPKAVEPIRFMATPPAVLARCRRDPSVRPACPTQIPVIPGWNVYPRRGSRGIFGIERGGEAPGRPGLNRPPALVHVELARDLDRWVPWSWPSGPAVSVRRGLLLRDREEALRLGPMTWGGRDGFLALAPPFPVGGSQGNHVVFRWRERGETYAIGLHAWEPFPEAVATLRRIVESIPPARRS